MNSSNELLGEIARTPGAARDPGLTVVVAFDFYDGPESGLALCSSGAGVRFKSLGDSSSRLFRAFELVPIDGDWRSRVESLRTATWHGTANRVLVPPASALLEKLEREVSEAPATGHYVAVGSPYLEFLRVATASLEQLNVLRRLDGSPAAFRCAHAIIKGKVDFQMAAE